MEGCCYTATSRRKLLLRTSESSYASVEVPGQAVESSDQVVSSGREMRPIAIARSSATAAPAPVVSSVGAPEPAGAVASVGDPELPVPSLGGPAGGVPSPGGPELAGGLLSVGGPDPAGGLVSIGASAASIFR